MWVESNTFDYVKSSIALLMRTCWEQTLLWCHSVFPIWKTGIDIVLFNSSDGGVNYNLI